jgi:hypothetical protein
MLKNRSKRVKIDEMPFGVERPNLNDISNMLFRKPQESIGKLRS